MRPIKMFCLLTLFLAAGCGDPYAQGMDLLQKGDYEKAAQFFLAQTKKHPDDPRAFNELGFAYARLKMYPEAGQSYMKALELNPDYFEARLNVGTLQLLKFEYDTAEAHLKKAIELNPSCEPCYVNLAWTYFQMDRYDEALQAINKAVELSGGRNQYPEVIEPIKKRKAEWDKKAEEIRKKRELEEAKQNQTPIPPAPEPGGTAEPPKPEAKP